MKILHLDSGREMRGGQWQALRLHRGLLAAGHSSLLLAPEDSPLYRHVHSLSLPVAPLRPLEIAARSRHFDLLHAHDSRSHTIGAVFSRVPLVVSRRVGFPVRTSMASRWKYRKAGLFLAVSQYVAGQLRHANVEEERIEVVYDGVPVPSVSAQGDAVLIPHTEDPQKGMAMAQSAAVLAQVNATVTHNLEADLPRSRALIYLTRSEGLGSGILLAMAHGVTVIASNTGGIPEMIENGCNGILVPNEVNSVAEAINRIDPALGRTARATVRERFTEERMVHATTAAYRKLLNR